MSVKEEEGDYSWADAFAECVIYRVDKRKRLEAEREAEQATDTSTKPTKKRKTPPQAN